MHCRWAMCIFKHLLCAWNKHQKLCVYILWNGTSFRIGFQVWVSDWFLFACKRTQGDYYFLKFCITIVMHAFGLTTVEVLSDLYPPSAPVSVPLGAPAVPVILPSSSFWGWGQAVGIHAYMYRCLYIWYTHMFWILPFSLSIFGNIYFDT